MPSKGLPAAEIETTGRAGVSAAHAAPVLFGSALRVVKNSILSPGDGVSASTTEDTVLALMNTATTTATLTLSSSDAVEGRIVIVKDVGGNAATNAITVATEGTETIDGATSASIATNYGSLRLVSDGSNWYSF